MPHVDADIPHRFKDACSTLCRESFNWKECGYFAHLDRLGRVLGFRVESFSLSGAGWNMHLAPSSEVSDNSPTSLEAWKLHQIRELERLPQASYKVEAGTCIANMLYINIVLSYLLMLTTSLDYVALTWRWSEYFVEAKNTCDLFWSFGPIPPCFMKWYSIVSALSQYSRKYVCFLFKSYKGQSSPYLQSLNSLRPQPRLQVVYLFSII